MNVQEITSPAFMYRLKERQPLRLIVIIKDRKLKENEAVALALYREKPALPWISKKLLVTTKYKTKPGESDNFKRISYIITLNESAGTGSGIPGLVLY